MNEVNTCGYSDRNEVTHYYETVGGGRTYVCQHHADRFGYPQYLVPLSRPEWRKEIGFLTTLLIGDGEHDERDGTVLFDQADATLFLAVHADESPMLVVSDAIYYEGEAVYTSSKFDPRVSIELVCVTVLPLV